MAVGEADRSPTNWSMDATLLLHGFGLGFAIAAPVGPVGILVIRRTLSGGQRIGLVSGLGAATAYAFYGSVAAFGLTFISSILISESTWIRLIGGALLCYLGLTLLISRPASAAASAEEQGLVAAYASVASLTLTNPATILSFAAAFAAFGLTNTHGNYLAASLLLLGVFLGSAFWWALLTTLVGLLRSRLNARRLLWVNRASGAILTTFDLVSVGSALASVRRAFSAY